MKEIILTSNNIPLEILSISTSFSSLKGYSVVLKEIGGSRKLQITVGASEAQALAISVEKIITSRPMTHHFIQMILNEFELTLKYVQIYKYEDGIYFAQAVFEDNFGNVKHIDCRSSDAICIALKMDKPILALEEIFDNTTQKYLDTKDENKSDLKNQDLTSLEVSKLKFMLKEAIEKEEFELAAKIQDELNRRNL